MKLNNDKVGKLTNVQRRKSQSSCMKVNLWAKSGTLGTLGQ